MHPDTIAAAMKLAAAIKEHPEDCEELEAYGRLPMHLLDLLEDQRTDE